MLETIVILFAIAVVLGAFPRLAEFMFALFLILLSCGWVALVYAVAVRS